MATELAKIIADFQTSLATKIDIGASTGTLLSSTDDDGNTIPNGRYFFTIDGDNSQKEHISCELNSTTKAMTSIKSVSRQGVETANAVREHRVGATIIITDFAHIKKINDLLNGTTDLDADNPLLYDAEPSITNDEELATKKYMDDLANVGAPNASTTVKGITKMSVAPASATNPIAVGDNDPRVPTTDENNALVGTGTPSSANVYVTEDDPNLTNNVKLTGAQTVAGIKTFSSLPILPATTPTTANQAVTKKYIDDLLVVTTGSVVDGTATIYYSKRGKTYFNLRIVDSVRIQGNGYPFALKSDANTYNKICSLLGKTLSSIQTNAFYFNSTSSTILGYWTGSTWDGYYQNGYPSVTFLSEITVQ